MPVAAALKPVSQRSVRGHRTLTDIQSVKILGKSFIMTIHSTLWTALSGHKILSEAQVLLTDSMSKVYFANYWYASLLIKTNPF